MDISVIVPIYQVESYIERSLTSLFRQSKCDGVEFILVDDASQDRSMDIAREVISHYPTLDIKIVEHSENRGLASARLSGIKIATGRYIQHVDSDDWCEPDMLKELFDFACSNDADIVGCDYFISYQRGERYMRQPLPTQHDTAFRELIRGSIQHAIWIKFARRSIYTDNNIDVTSPNLCQWEDLIFAAQILYHSRQICYLPKAFIHYQQNRESLSKSISAKNISDVTNALCELNSFIERHAEPTLYSQELKHRTLMAHALFISRSRGCDQKSCANSLPAHLRGEVWSHPALTLQSKIALTFAYMKMLPLSNLVLKAAEITKQMLGRLY